MEEKKTQREKKERATTVLLWVIAVTLMIPLILGGMCVACTALLGGGPIIGGCVEGLREGIQEGFQGGCQEDLASKPSRDEVVRKKVKKSVRSMEEKEIFEKAKELLNAEELEDYVHTLAWEEANNINNKGIDAQLEYLERVGGIDFLITLIEEKDNEPL